MTIRILAVLALCLTACGSFATEGEPGPMGPAGPPGADGRDGSNGASGKDAVLSGERLTVRYIVGNDCDDQGQCSRVPTGDFLDEDRGEVCSFKDYKGEWLCLPAAVPATEWFTWADAACAGARAFGVDYNGAVVVTVLSNNPAVHGSILARGEPVSEVYWRGPANNEACKPYPDAVDYYAWPEASAEVFVAGEVMP